eukprot:CAMPEP_0183295098 /NCGR_PEP_ID=MMETSP0160_2-20130417/3180_1 /TAXON_ID=2839 ORGANISM="Odontella Sinensis, Strain Grunow 1884" /NCGR_SAMPLE_ID=MMETSP0160_2 /ASSEMBLY_ACC=CAM_ASM_000250 /LENGTH=68 /DNA_ID=CAMNT_0025456521 /DNA_START=269 /DNA_END=475 /DNA_ORIENTATION=-
MHQTNRPWGDGAFEALWTVAVVCRTLEGAGPGQTKPTIGAGNVREEEEDDKKGPDHGLAERIWNLVVV